MFPSSLQLIRAGQRTKAHRHTPNVVYHVAEGRGETVIEGRPFAWAPGDTFVVPAWAWHEHRSAAGADAVFFSYSDAPVLAALGLLREQVSEE
ncbi:MAG TPA: cupin domain-containing protein [Dehalococcoidia bacterium]|nr:cupin domain-containing protein [Dehalococcoidia bacterium]